MSLPPHHAQALLDLEARHEELFKAISDLEKRVASVLGQYQVGRQTTAQANLAATPSDVAPEILKTAA